MSYFFYGKPHRYLTKELPMSLREDIAEQISAWPAFQPLMCNLCEFMTELLPAPEHSQYSTLLEYTLTGMTQAWKKSLEEEINYTRAYKKSFLAMYEAMSYVHTFIVTDRNKARPMVWDCIESTLLAFIKRSDGVIKIHATRTLSAKSRHHANIFVLHHLVEREHLRALNVISHAHEVPCNVDINALLSNEEFNHE